MHEKKGVEGQEQDSIPRTAAPVVVLVAIIATDEQSMFQRAAIVRVRLRDARGKKMPEQKQS